MIFTFLHLQIVQNGAREAYLCAVGGADTDDRAFKISGRLDCRFLGSNHTENRFRKVIIDEDHIDTAGAGGENRSRARLPDLCLAGRHGLKDL